MKKNLSTLLGVFTLRPHKAMAMYPVSPRACAPEFDIGIKIVGPDMLLQQFSSSGISKPLLPLGFGILQNSTQAKQGSALVCSLKNLLSINLTQMFQNGCIRFFMKTPLLNLTLFLFAGAAFLAPITALRAEILVNDNLVSGLFDPEGKNTDQALLKWPEDVLLSSPPRGQWQASPCIIRNSNQTFADSEISIYSRVVGQVFPIPEDSDQILEKIFIVGNSLLPSKKSMKLSPRLVDLGSSPSMDEYDAGTNLFEGDPLIELTTPSDKNSAQIVEFTFTGNDRIRLKKGHTYSFELVMNEPNSGLQFIWYRSGGMPSEMQDCPLFFVPCSAASTTADKRTALKDRQTFIGIKTSPVK